MNIVSRKIGRRRYLVDQDMDVYIITWYDVVTFPMDRTAENIKHINAGNIPLPLLWHIMIRDRGTVIFTDGVSFKIIASLDPFLKDLTGDRSAEAVNIIRELLEYIDYEKIRIKEHSRKQTNYARAK